MQPPEIFSLRNVYKFYPVTRGILKREAGRLNVLNGVSLTIREGETFGLVGESGCGKSTLAKLLVKLIQPSSGDIVFSGKPLSDINGREKKQFYRQVQMIFQDPYSSLNPRLKVRDIVGEMVRIRGASKEEEKREVLRLLNDVGLTGEALDKYPHEFSGGQRQRISIARALIVRPRVLIADEPVSALDLSTQSQVLALLKDLRQRYNLTILFISHDLDAVASFCDRAAVMYLGRIVELLEAHQLFSNGRHPYLQALVESAPVTDPALRRRRRVIPGETPSPLHLPSGCAFHPRCPYKISRCTTECPTLSVQEGDDNHLAACHLA
jgi:oligopeptide/dipeptide ABC transporter ATP-binding protein